MNAVQVTVFIIYFILLIYFSRQGYKKAGTLDDFTVGGWSMGLVINVATFTATWVSAASVLGVPSMLYGVGFAAITGWFAGWFFANALMPILAYKIRRPEFPVRTVPEFMRLRYEPFAERSYIQIIASLTMIAGYLIYVTIQIKGLGMIIATLTGIPYEVGVFVFAFFILVTVFGGMWSVATTDLFNTVIIMIGLVIAAIAILPQVGGWSEMFARAMEISTPAVQGGKPTPPGGLLDPLGTFTLSAMIGIFISNSLGASVAPHWPTRLLAAKNLRTAILTPLISTFIIAIVFLCLMVLGIGGRVLVPTMPAGKQTDWVMPMLISQFMNPVIAGIMLAAIFAAALSTANAMTFHSALAITYDIIRNLSRKTINPQTLITMTKFTLVILGIVAIILALNPPAFIAMAAACVFGLFGGTFIAPMYLGLYWKKANKLGGYLGSIVGGLTYVITNYLITIKAMPGTIPAIVLAVAASTLCIVIAAYVSPPPPREAWEPYFEPEISENTRQVIFKAMKNISK
ncbi:sodium:solute symporter family protein [Desulfofundulus salinus]|uniref:Sodium:solute symporter family protein n=1 Tax=Desulfofundulus salinus TaxID=2419843 RepID=A0A494WUV9_9FIRM|nr:sodium:solute symporter family protein [Desulfofundulus salinum]RKO66663.1 sodium:solute symporter family protein [Desulfofundulus salinum]